MIRASGASRGAALAAAILLGTWIREGRAEEEHVFPLDGAKMVPPNHSKATARATVILKGLKGRLRIRWQGLSGRPMRFEIHGPALAGQTGELILAVAAPRQHRARSDSVDIVFPVAQSRKKVFRDEQTYLSVKTSRFAGGEIRGQIIPTDEENDEDD
jgi:hypothetical protein